MNRAAQQLVEADERRSSDGGSRNAPCHVGTSGRPLQLEVALGGQAQVADAVNSPNRRDAVRHVPGMPGGLPCYSAQLTTLETC